MKSSRDKCWALPTSLNGRHKSAGLRPENSLRKPESSRGEQIEPEFLDRLG